MGQHASRPTSVFGDHHKKNTPGEPDDYLRRDRQYDGLPLVRKIQPYHRSADPRRWWLCPSRPCAGKCLTRQMKTLVCIKPGELEYREAGAPLARPGQSIIKI